MNLLFVHAHCDDFEFTGAGTFELWRRRDPQVRRRLLVCTDGAAGHQTLSREETARRRFAEQEAAARKGGVEFRLLRDRSGAAFREGRLQASTDFVPALWQEIRQFEPDYLFCPPLPEDSLAGIHVDHLEVAQAVRSVAYMVNVPHAFTPEYPAHTTDPVSVRTPVILHTYDGYMGVGQCHDIAVDIESVVDHVADLAWCHESQVREWLPWVNRHGLEASPDPGAWRKQYRQALERRRLALGINRPGFYEVFRVTAWGEVPTIEQLMCDLPGISLEASQIDLLTRRLETWRRARGD